MAVERPGIISYFACHGDPTEKGILQAYHELAIEDIVRGRCSPVNWLYLLLLCILTISHAINC